MIEPELETVDPTRAAMRGTNQTGVRAHNERLVLSILRQENHFITRLTVRQLVGFERAARVTEKHRAVEFEVIVVAAIERVEVDRSVARQRQSVSVDGCLIGRHDTLIMSAQHVDVGGHVLQMPRVGDEVPERVTCGQRRLGRWRHLHQMDVELE